MAKTASKAKSPVSQPTTGSGVSTQPVNAGGSSQASLPAKKSNGKNDPPATLPASIVNALPAGADIIRHVQAIEALFDGLKAQVEAARRAGPVQLARMFVVLHRLNERMLSDKAFKNFRTLFNDTKTSIVPDCFDMAGVLNVPLSEGFRVGISTTWRASVREGKMSDAVAYMKESGNGDIVSITINASTLSSLAREMMEESNVELPDDIFNMVPTENTSVTKIS